MSARTMTIELDDDVAEGLAKAASLRGARAEVIAAGAIAMFVAEEASAPFIWTDEDLAAIEEGRAQIARGEGFTQEEVEAEMAELLRDS